MLISRRVRFLAGLLAIDAAIIGGFALFPGRQGPPAAGETARAVDGGAARAAAPQWKNSSSATRGVDPAALGQRAAAVYLAARKRVGKSKRVILNPPRRVGDD